MRRIICSKVNNMRDIGGIFSKSGKLIQQNRFIRSSFPVYLTDKEKEYLLNNKIDTVIDLRKSDDIRKFKNALNTDLFEYFNVSLLGENPPENEREIPTGYLSIIDDKCTMNKVFSIIAKAANGVFYNCNAGKDRTGIISMLLLLIAKAYDDDIIVDYQVSYTYIRNSVREMNKSNPHLPNFVGQSKPEYMEKTLILFREKYHNIENYMEQIGINSETLECIRKKLFD